MASASRAGPITRTLDKKSNWWRFLTFEQTVGALSDWIEVRLRPALRLLDRHLSILLDPRCPDWAVAALIVAWTACWFLYRAVAFASVDLPFDMTEAFAWSRSLDWSYPKHPPMLAWITAAWFGVFPVRDWSFHLLAAANAGVTLWVIWLIGKRCLPPERRLIALALPTLVPLIPFLGLLYNANSVLMPFWALTTLFFLISFKTRSAWPAALAGAAAAGAFLGKYYSVFLLLGLALAALAHPDRGRYLKSPAPWVSLAVGLSLVAPHLFWLAAHSVTPLDYAAAMHQGTPSAVLLAAIGTPVAVLGYASLAILTFLLAVRPTLRDLRDLVWPADADRRMVAVAFLGPLVVSTIALAAFGKVSNSVWTIPAWTLFGAFMLSPPGLAIDRRSRLGALATMVALPLILDVISPVMAIYYGESGDKGRYDFASRLAHDIDSHWHQLIDLPLAYVAGDADASDGLTFYAVDHPPVLPDFAAAAGSSNRSDRIRRGIVIICRAANAGCLATAEKAAGQRDDVVRYETTVSRTFLGREQRSAPLVVFMLPPVSAQGV